MDIAQVAMDMKLSQVSSQASVAMLKKTMDTSEQMADMLIGQMMSLDVGPMQPSAVDISV